MKILLREDIESDGFGGIINTRRYDYGSYERVEQTVFDSNMQQISFTISPMIPKSFTYPFIPIPNLVLPVKPKRRVKVKCKRNNSCKCGCVKH